jgi:hypothetical protein
VLVVLTYLLAQAENKGDAMKFPHLRHFRPVKKRAKAKNTHFKNKIKTFNAYTLPKVHQLGGITRHTWHIV